MGDSEILSFKEQLFSDICGIINNARIRVASVANSETTLLYWNVGNRINIDVLENQRAEYGQQIVATLSRQLRTVYGEKGFEEKSLRRMMQFAEVFNDFNFVATVSRQLSWSHFVELLPLKDKLQREFYLSMAVYERWSVRMLREKIDGMLYERTAISSKPEDVIKLELNHLQKENILSPDLVFKSQYFLDFTGLRGTYSEKSLEDVLVNKVESFIMELGYGFSFVERQKRIIIDGEDYYIDLLFYHRKLRRLIAIELKLGRFKAAYKGQVELYLRWLDKYERQEGEESPLGLILCSEGSEEQIELLELDKSGIRVAKYLTELPEKKLLEKQLRQAIDYARQRGLDIKSEE